MMFVIAKVLKPFLLPPTIVAIGMMACVVLLVRKKYRLVQVLLVCTGVLYYILSIEPTAMFLMRSLETQESHISVQNMIDASTTIDAIVVLGGGALEGSPDISVTSELSGASWKRLWHGVEMFKLLNGSVPLLYSGGSGDPFQSQSNEAILAKHYAMGMGIPEDHFIIENNSRTTWESGDAVYRIVEDRFPGRAHRVVLVTSAWHLPRSASLFRRRGFDVFPAPADFAFSGRESLDILSFFPDVGQFSLSVLGLHEWIGMAVYRMRE